MVIIILVMPIITEVEVSLLWLHRNVRVEHVARTVKGQDFLVLGYVVSAVSVAVKIGEDGG